MANEKKLSKRIEKLENQAAELRKQAEKKGMALASKATDVMEDRAGSKKDKKKDKKKDAKKQEEEATSGGGKGKFALLLAIAAGVMVALKKKRDQELDEALWEEPRSV